MKKTSYAKELGGGTYGTVFELNGMAVKSFEKRHSLIQEYCVLQYLKGCDYIVKPLYIDLDKLCLGMDLYEKDFDTWIGYKDKKEAKKKSDRNYKEYLFMFEQLLKGLIYIHDLNMVHADIKPSNILVKGSKCVIADCGFVSIEDNDKCILTAPRYREPIPTFKSAHDMYSCGIMLVEFFGSYSKKSATCIIRELIDIQVKNNSLKEDLIKILDKCKKKKYNPYKQYNLYMKKNKQVKNIITKILDTAKELEYEYSYRTIHTIKDPLIKEICSNLLNRDYKNRYTSRQLYKKLYGKDIIKTNNNNYVSIHNIKNHAFESMYFNIKKFCSEYKVNLESFIMIKAAYCLIKFFELNKKENNKIIYYIIATLFILCCNFSDKKTNDVLYNLIKKSDEKDIIYELLCSPEFISSIFKIINTEHEIEEKESDISVDLEYNINIVHETLYNPNFNNSLVLKIRSENKAYIKFKKLHDSILSKHKLKLNKILSKMTILIMMEFSKYEKDKITKDYFMAALYLVFSIFYNQNECSNIFKKIYYLIENKIEELFNHNGFRNLISF